MVSRHTSSTFTIAGRTVLVAQGEYFEGNVA